MEAIAPVFQVAVEGSVDRPTTQPSRTVSRQTLLKLIGEFLDDEGPRQRRQIAMTAVRAQTIGEIRTVRAQATATRPMLDLEAARLLEDFGCVFSSMEQPTWTKTEGILSARLWGAAAQSGTWPPARNPKPPRYARPIGSLRGYGDSLAILEFGRVAERRVAATDLAIQIYRAEHHAWPASLDVLVPAYLPEVPMDPFSTANEPLGYLIDRGASSDGEVRPLLFYRAVGGGPPGSPPAERSFGHTRLVAQWHDLSQWKPATMPATLPGTLPSKPWTWRRRSG